MSVNDLKEKGNAAVKSKDFQKAIDFYTQALAIDSTSEAAAALFSNRALCWQSLNNYEKAMSDSEECIRLRPTWLKGYFRKGVALEAMNNLDEAYKAFREAYNQDKENTETGEKLHALDTRIRERNDRAKPSAMKTPQDAKIIGNSLFAEGKYDRAAEFYTRAIELQKENTLEKANYYSNRAACYQQTHLYDAMVEDCTAALTIHPQNVKAFMRRAIAYEGLEKWKHALADYESAKALAPSLTVLAQGILRCNRAIRG